MKTCCGSRIRGFRPGIMIILFILTIFSYASGTEETTVQPTKPDVEIFLEKGIYQWTQNNPYIKKLASTKSWEDLKLSGQFIGLLTLGNQLEKQLGVQFSSALIRELLKAPIEISLWDVFEKDKDTNFVIALDLQPQLLSLVKLAELYSQSIKKSTAIKKNNYNILKTRWLKQHFFHLVHQNQLVVSNDLDYLLNIMGKVSKEGIISSFRSSIFYRNYHQPNSGTFKCRINLVTWLKNLQDILDKDDMQLAVNMDLDETVNYYPFYLTADPGFQAERMCKLADCSHLIPKEPLLALSGLYPSRYYLGMFRYLPSVKALQGDQALDIKKDLVPLFNERFFFYIKNLETSDTDNFLNGVMGFSLNKCTAEQKQKIIDFVQLVMTQSGKEMKKEKLKAGIEIYRYPDADEPAFCVLKRWLLVGTGVEQLKQSIAVYSKKISSISDGKEYRGLKKAFSRKGYCHIYFSPSLFFQSLGQHMLFLAKSASDFNAADVKHKILPVVDILSEMSSFGVFLNLKGEILKGEVKFVKQK